MYVAQAGDQCSRSATNNSEQLPPVHASSKLAARHCIGSNWRVGSSQVGFGQCPLWVKSRHRKGSAECPLYPRKRTSMNANAMSALGQKRTSDRLSPISANAAQRPISAID